MQDVGNRLKIYKLFKNSTQLLNINKKFELMLTRCGKAYSSSGSVV